MNVQKSSLDFGNLKIEANEEVIEDETSLHAYNLFQQFFIIGINPKIIHLINRTNLKSIPEQLLGPKIISKFPNINLPYITINDSIIPSHCFPNGFSKSIIECEDSEVKEKLQQTYDFIFSFDNFQMNKSSSLRINKIYYICYLFYEKFDQYQSCIDSFKRKNNITVKNNIKYKNILIPKAIVLSTFSPYFYQAKALLHYLKKYIDKYSYNNLMRQSSLRPTNFNFSGNNFPIENIIEGLIYNIPGLPRANFVLKLSQDNFICDVNDSKLKEIIFENSPTNKTPKPIINYSLLMKFFRVEEIFKIIKYIILEEPILFFSDNIQYLTYTIEGLLSLIYPFEYYYPVVAVLPEENYSFINIYNSFIFGINQKYTEDFFNLKDIDIDEKKNINIIIIEDRFSKLLNANEKEKEKINPILNTKPNETKLLKIDQKSFNKPIQEIKVFYKNIKLKINNEEKNEKEDNNDDKEIKLPIHYFVKCCKRIESNVEIKFKEIKIKLKDKENDKNAYKKLCEIEKENLFSTEITESFLYFFICILLHYQDYCTKYHLSYVLKRNENDSNNKSYSQKDNRYCRSAELEKKYFYNQLKINDLFNCDKFIENIPALDKPFYTRFFQTKIFYNFLLKKFFPQSTQDKLDLLFFDDKINEKLSRESGSKKVETKFLEYDNSNISGDIIINTFQNYINVKYKEFLSQEKNQIKALNYFQYITSQTVTNTETNGYKSPCLSINSNDDLDCSSNNNTICTYLKVNFYYFIFPKLLNDNIFYKIKKSVDDNLFFLQRTRTNFTSQNSDCLFNQFIKEGNSIIYNENITKNYLNYHYSLNPSMTYCRPYEHYIKNLWLKYLSKTFYQIPYSKKNYVFHYLMYFMEENKDILDEKIIIMAFNSFIKYGDKRMVLLFFPFIRNKTYSLYLNYREKTRPDKNYISFNNLQKIDNIFVYDDIVEHRNERTYSGYNLNKLKLSNLSSLRFSNISITYKSGIIKRFEDENEDTSTTKEDKILDKLNFTLNLFCNQMKGNQICGKPCELQTNFIFDDSKKFMNFKCLKCGKNQDLTISCDYEEQITGNNNKNDIKNYIINTKLYSPSTLIEEKWLEKSDKLDISEITKNHLESYICAMFYFYEQGLLCDFLIPELLKNNNLKEEKINNDFKKSSLSKSKETKLVEIIEEVDIDSKKENNILCLNKEVEISSSQGKNFFELKKSIKPSSLNNQSKKKNNNKKTVDFSLKSDNKKQNNHKKNIFSFSGFVNNKE